MKHFHGCPKERKCGRFHQKHNKGFHKKSGDDEEQLLYQLFKQFLKNKLDEQRQGRQQGESREPVSQCQETGEPEVVDLCGEEKDCGEVDGPRKHCHRFGLFKRGKKHNRWGKHHHGHHHGPHQHHGPHHHGPHQHGPHHHHHGHGKQHGC